MNRPTLPSMFATTLALPQITLIAVDTRAPALAAQSLRHSMSGTDFARVMLFTHACAAADPGLERAGIEGIAIDPLSSGADYSRFMLRELARHITTSHVLVTQWDGFVVDPRAWRDEFLQWDYLGAVWPDQPAGRDVGNGGFSLRSRRLLVAAAADPAITRMHPEDEVLCRTHRAHLERAHGIRFAPAPLARQFAFENEAPRGPCFGFHGPYHLPRFLDEATLQRWLAELPDAFYLGRDARRLARALLAQRMPVTAQQVLRRRAAAGGGARHTRLLGLAAALLARLPGHAARP
ncbi:MAG: hypothetical protein KGI90_04550 [Burkholderiales bacterium]|nr:hypothetical protein [Burkholderiales bacterium]